MYSFDEFGVWESSVSSESPDLTGRRGDTGDGTDQRETDHEHCHDYCRREGLGCIVQDLDDRDACGGVQDLVDVADAEAEGDEHAQSQNGVADGCPYHGRGKHSGRVLELF